MLRRLAFLAALVGGLVALTFGLRGPVMRHVVRGAMDRTAARASLEIDVREIEPVGFGAVVLHDVLVGVAGHPLLAVRRIEGQIPPADLLQGTRMPERLTIQDFTLTLAGDGTLEGLVDAVRKLAPTRPAVAPEPAAGVTRRPTLALSGGRLVDEGGLVEADGIEGEIAATGPLALRLQLKRPTVSACTVEGDPDAVRVRCDPAVAIQLRPGFALEVPEAAAARRPAATVEIRGAHLRGANLPSVLAPFVDGLGFDARLGLDPVPGPAGPERPLQAALTFPAGGKIGATGTISGHRAALRTEVADLDLAPISASMTGLASARLSLTVDLDARHADLQGQVQLSQLLVEHKAIAGDKVGPYSLGIEGEIAVDVEGAAPPSAPGAPGTVGPIPLPVAAPPASAAEPAAPPPIPRVKLELRDAIVHLGLLDVRVDASVEADSALRRARVGAATGRVPAEQFVSAFPPGLLPHLQPLQASGEGGLGFTLTVDMDQPENTDLQVKPDLKDLHVTRLNPALDLGPLRRVFETRFEMPDGEIVRSVTGPESDRWTPLTQVAPLLPIAIVTQEDGGFWNHGGVSLLHLRGSLQANVEKRRFARGGSTLTMQLARNVFLNRHKTLSRKLEEVIVAWLMEQEFSKNELMELYLNVVEFGPRLFGIGDAAAYYFAKKPGELTPVEVAFLVRLLPNPRKFHDQFEKGEVDKYYAASMQRLLGLLVDRGFLSRAEMDAANPRTLWVRPPALEAPPSPVH